MKRLRPVQADQQATRQLATRIEAILSELFLAPITRLFKRERLENVSKRRLSDLFRSGRLTYHQGVIRASEGQSIPLSVSRFLRKLGATFSSSQKGFRLSKDKLPDDAQIAITDRTLETQAAIDRAISAMDETLTRLETSQSELKKVVSQALGSVVETIDTDLEDQLTDRTEAALSIEMRQTPDERAEVAKAVTDNLALSIVNFGIDEIKKVRALAADTVSRAERPETLVDTFRERFKVSENKAKFLARQETALLTAKMTEAHYKQAGIPFYEWRTSEDERVRADHKALDGTVHSWDSPPIINRKTGKRGHPKSDWQCRCLAIPIIMND